MSPEPLLPESSPLPKLHVVRKYAQLLLRLWVFPQGSWQLSYLPGDLYMQIVRIGRISTLSSGEL